jgi:hypothetical protein
MKITVSNLIHWAALAATVAGLILAAVLVGLAMTWLGYALWSARRPAQAAQA